MATEIRVPTLGESVTEATIAQWFKKPGDAVNADEPLVELETDKVTVEVPAPVSGKLDSIDVKEGDTVEVGTLLGSILEGAAGAASAPAAEAAPAAKAAPAAAAETVEVLVPHAGESVTEAEVGEWSVKVGDVVKADDILVELETDKAAQEVPSPVAGTVVEIAQATGATVEPGNLLCKIAKGDGAAVAAPAPAAAAPAPAVSGSGMPAAPSAAKMMAEKGLSADQVAGSGKRGQVLKGDVLAAVAAGATAAPAAAPAPVAVRAPSAPTDEVREERVRMTKLRQTIARRLKDAQNSAAMLTTYNEVDMKPIMDLRKQYKDIFEKKHGVKLGFMVSSPKR